MLTVLKERGLQACTYCQDNDASQYVKWIHIDKSQTSIQPPLHHRHARTRALHPTSKIVKQSVLLKKQKSPGKLRTCLLSQVLNLDSLYSS